MIKKLEKKMKKAVEEFKKNQKKEAKAKDNKKAKGGPSKYNIYINPFNEFILYNTLKYSINHQILRRIPELFLRKNSSFKSEIHHH